jgi:hypothetical protein
MQILGLNLGDWTFPLILAIWFLLVFVVFPRLGVPT